MGLWKHGVDQTLAVAGMQNQETERRYLPDKNQLNQEGALCTAQAENQTKGTSFKPFIRRARERVTGNRDNSNGPFLGLRSAKRRVKEITSRRRCDLL